ncbi:MAG TPA: tRNA epoxyqueuosine(34) reductase QueG [Pseudomonadales bacterium]|nr:tRNA epoxyqueuosine(34) reductase QueG [Pseudomonadales bacterium]
MDIPILDWQALARQIKSWGQELGFQQVGIAGNDLAEHPAHLQRWLTQQFHGDMHYMERHGDKRGQPNLLVEGTRSVIAVRMDYLPPALPTQQCLQETQRAFVARYALGRDYHKLMRYRLQQLANRISDKVGLFGYRAFVDSAPVLEKALAEQAGLGWIGKNTLLINSKAGSYFFLGELYTDLPLPTDTPASFHCGSCSACLDICPTNAFVGPFQLDARKCIAYLTIEYSGTIPIEFRTAMGNRIFGCDDCQMVCPWNKFAKPTSEQDFFPRHQLDSAMLLDLFNWSETQFLERFSGSAIRRTGYIGWLRNIAVALGNAEADAEIVQALLARKTQYADNELLLEHIEWAIQQQRTKVTHSAND